jgi:hypothetical protein
MITYWLDSGCAQRTENLMSQCGVGFTSGDGDRSTSRHRRERRPWPGVQNPYKFVWIKFCGGTAHPWDESSRERLPRLDFCPVSVKCSFADHLQLARTATLRKNSPATSSFQQTRPNRGQSWSGRSPARPCSSRNQRNKRLQSNWSGPQVTLLRLADPDKRIKVRPSDRRGIFQHRVKGKLGHSVAEARQTPRAG